MLRDAVIALSATLTVSPTEAAAMCETGEFGSRACLAASYELKNSAAGEGKKKQGSYSKSICYTSRSSSSGSGKQQNGYHTTIATATADTSCGKNKQHYDRAMLYQVYV